MATDLATTLDTVCVSVADSVAESLTPQDAADVKRWAADAGYEARQVRVEEEGIQTLVIGDGDRTYLYMARSAMNGLQTKLKGASKAPLEKRLGKHGARRTDYAQAKLATLSQFVRYYQDACEVPTQICVAPSLDQLDRKASLLVMLGSAYNYAPPSNGWTGAALATGVSMLPMELLFEELPHNFGYLYSEMQDYGDGFSVPTTEKTTWAEMTWIDGCCDGCRHVKSAWEVILKRPVVAGRGRRADGTTDDVAIAFEINNSIGPMASWTAARVARIEPKVRTIEGSHEEDGGVGVRNVKMLMTLKGIMEANMSGRATAMAPETRRVDHLNVALIFTTLAHAVMDAHKKYRCEEFISNAEYIAKKLMVPKDKQVAQMFHNFAVGDIIKDVEQAEAVCEKFCRGITLGMVWFRGPRIVLGPEAVEHVLDILQGPRQRAGAHSMLEELAYFLLAKSQMAVEKWALSTYKIRATDTLKSLRRTACLHAR
ncbi:Dhx36 [Symbiodinium necroappetens]|uniref:Dhx36 protein n=1 Tax=Symbiodinium necroappetens TaxID=1628268 RepID=A0A812IYU0_9DINO|nr:Dhx36 [Symbiodinium necroappetens]